MGNNLLSGGLKTRYICHAHSQQFIIHVVTIGQDLGNVCYNFGMCWYPKSQYEMEMCRSNKSLYDLCSDSFSGA